MCPDREESAVLYALLSGIVTGLVFFVYLAIVSVVVPARRKKSGPRQGWQRQRRGKRELIWIHSEADRDSLQSTAPKRPPFPKRLGMADAIRTMCRATASFASPRQRRTAWPTCSS